MSKKIDKPLPDLDPKLFWDIVFPTRSKFESNYFFIIERVLMRGDTKSLIKVINYYSTEQIKEVIIKSRQISNKTRAFFTVYLKIDNLCLPERSNQQLWFY